MNELSINKFLFICKVFFTLGEPLSVLNWFLGLLPQCSTVKIKLPNHLFILMFPHSNALACTRIQSPNLDFSLGKSTSNLTTHTSLHLTVASPHSPSPIEYVVSPHVVSFQFTQLQSLFWCTVPCVLSVAQPRNHYPGQDAEQLQASPALATPLPDTHTVSLPYPFEVDAASHSRSSVLHLYSFAFSELSFKCSLRVRSI